MLVSGKNVRQRRVYSNLRDIKWTKGKKKKLKGIPPETNLGIQRGSIDYANVLVFFFSLFFLIGSVLLIAELSLVAMGIYLVVLFLLALAVYRLLNKKS